MTDELARWIILAPAIFCASATLINCYRERTQAGRDAREARGQFAPLGVAHSHTTRGASAVREKFQ